MSRIRLTAVVALATALAALPGCILDNSTITQAPVGTAATDSRAPIIAAIDYSPKAAVGKGDFVTFTVVATAPSGKPLQYTWTSTKGLLTANSGTTVAWRPTKADGSFEPGLSTVMLVVSDGTFTATANVNILIDATGQATVSKVDLPTPSAGATGAPTPTPGSSATPGPKPSVAPTARPTTAPTAAPTATPAPLPSAGEPTTGTSELLFHQVDFRERYTHARKEGSIKLDGVPIGGYGDELAPITWLSTGGTPDGDKAYPNKFYWDAPNFEASALLIATNLAWWGDNLKGEVVARLTVDGAGGEQHVFDMVVGKHTAEWNGGTIADDPPAVRITGVGSGAPEARQFVSRFEFPQMAVKRVNIELLKAPMWNTTQYGVFQVHGITLWGGWKY